MSRHLGDTSCSIHTHNLHSSWDKVRTSSGVFLYSMNESTLLTKAVSALVFRRFTTAVAAAILLASYNDAAEEWERRRPDGAGGDGDGLFRPDVPTKPNTPNQGYLERSAGAPLGF